MSNREVAGVEKEKLGGWYGNGRWVCGCVRLCVCVRFGSDTISPLGFGRF